MRLFAFSDWRVQPTEWLFETLDQLDEPVDAVLYAGDDVDRFHTEEGNVLAALATETRLGTSLAVVGNDDRPASRDILAADGVHNLHEEPFSHAGYVFLGQEGSPPNGPGYIQHTEAEIERHLHDQYDGTEAATPVLISHSPPYGILDIGQRFGQQHIGSRAVRTFIEDHTPALTVCGHCHQFGGRADQGTYGTVINVASHDDPGAVGRYAVIELDGDSVEYELATTHDGVEHELLDLSQVGSNRIYHFLDADITSLEDFTDANRGTLLDLDGVGEWHVDRWMKEAQAVRNEDFLLHDPEAFRFLESDDLVLVDIETDLQQARVWLVGVYSYRDDEYTALFDPDDEAEVLTSLIEYLENHDEPTVVYYANNYLEERCLSDRLNEHGFQECVSLLEDAHDLCIPVQKHLLGPHRRIKLESLAEEVLGYEYADPELNGFIVGRLYTEYLLDGIEPDWERLIDYNRDDVLALKELVDWLRQLPPSTLEGLDC